MSQRRHSQASPPRTAVFLGSSTFSVPILKALLRAGGPVVAVVTRPDRPAGRGRRARPTPLKEAARRWGLAVLEPEQVNAPEVVAGLRRLAPDLVVLAAYGQVLGPEVLAAARVAPLNVHPSLLPRYRGPAPVAWALLRGERETGVTIIRMTEEVDAGLILAQEATAIGEEETAGELEARLARLGAGLLTRTLARLEEALAGARPQGPPPRLGSARAPRLTKADGLVDWSRPAEEIRRRVRGLSPWPGAYSFLGQGGHLLRVKLLRVRSRPPGERAGGTPRPAPGTVVQAGEGTLLVQAGRGLVEVRELQPAGGRPLEASAFLRGRRVREGDRFVDG